MQLRLCALCAVLLWLCALAPVWLVVLRSCACGAFVACVRCGFVTARWRGGAGALETVRAQLVSRASVSAHVMYTVTGYVADSAWQMLQV